jgi:hypothetical protein
MGFPERHSFPSVDIQANDTPMRPFTFNKPEEFRICYIFGRKSIFWNGRRVLLLEEGECSVRSSLGADEKGSFLTI